MRAFSNASPTQAQEARRAKSKNPPHETITLSVIDGLIRSVRPDRKGRYQVPCPLCSSSRSTSRSRSEAVLCIWTKHDGFASFKCIHCGEHGYARDNNAPPPDPKKIEQQRAENERKNRDDEKERLRKALWFWSRREPIAGTIVETYLREARGIKGPIPNRLFYLPPYKSYPPAMIAAFGIDRVCGVHLTNLKPDGSDKAYDADELERDKTKKNKIMIGSSSGWPIVLAPSNEPLGLAITEGIEDGLSVHQATGLGVWVAGDAGRLPKLAGVVPSYIECVTIICDDDDSGRRGSIELAHRLQARGIYVEQALHWRAAP